MASNTGMPIANFVRYNREKLGLTQEQLAVQAGVGKRFIWELEQGKKTLRLDKVNLVLGLFGHHVSTGSERVVDPYDILLNHFNKGVHIFLRDKTDVFGIIVDAVSENNVVKSWRFVPNRKAKAYQKTRDKSLEQIIDNDAIKYIENMDEL